MEEKTIDIKNTDRLPDIIGYIKKGEWKIPRFQREFVWEKKKVIELLDSMYRGFPIGSFFIWSPPKEYTHYYKDIPELRIEHDDTFYTCFILDGQQRLTSLYVTFRGLQIDGFDYSNICFNLDTEKFNYELSDNERNLSVSSILKDNFTEIYDILSTDRKKVFNKLRERFQNYPFPVILIKKKNIEEACKIFERINQGGKRLSIFDLVVAVTWDKDFELKKKIDEFNNQIKDSFGKIDYEVFSETISLIINGQCTKAFQLKLNSTEVKEKWPDVQKAIGKSVQFLRTNLKVKSYSYLPYRDMLALIAYYYYNCESKKIEVDRKFLEEWFWKVAFSNRYSGSSFNKIGEDRAYIFDRKIRGESFSINYDISINLDKIKNVNMGRKTALRNALIQIMIQQNPLSFSDNSPIDVERDFISEFNSSELHHIFPRAFLKLQGIKEKKATDLLVNLCLIDSSLNKSILAKSPKEYFTQYKEKNDELKQSLDSHLIQSDNESAIWENNFGLFIEQRAELLLRQVLKRIGDISAETEDEMESNPAQLIQRLEVEIRGIINQVLYDSHGESWWDVEKVIPQDVKDYTNDKIRKEKANKPYIPAEEWETPLRKLEQVNIMDYLKIILKNWKDFEEVFGSKKNIEKHFDGFSTIRNQIDHIKTIDPTEKKIGLASIEWLFNCIRKKIESEESEKEGGNAPAFLLVNELYEEIKDRILSLDSEIELKDQKYHKGFNKKNNFFNFASLRFRKDHIILTILIKKGGLSDPKGISEDITDRPDKEIRRIRLELKSKDEIDYSMELIKQAFDFNEEYTSQQNKEKTQRHYDRYDFWKGLLDVAKEKGADFQNLAPTHYHWIGKGSGKSGVSFNLCILSKFATVEVYMDIGKKEINKERFDKLIRYKDEIEDAFGNSLLWERLDDKRACRISYRFDGAGLKNKDSWSELQSKMVEKMMLLEKAFVGYVRELD